MAFDPIPVPTEGQTDWAGPLNTSLSLLNSRLSTVNSSADQAIAARDGAVAARDAAQIAAGQAQSVGTTNDTIMQGVINNASSATRIALNGLYSGKDLETTVSALQNRQSTWGTVNQLPASASKPEGAEFFAVDTGQVYLNTASGWVTVGGSGLQLGYAEQTPLVSNATTTPADVPGLSVTFIAGARPVKISLTARLAISVTTSVGYARIVLDGNEIGRINYVAGYADVWETHSWTRSVTGLTAGTSHTVKVQICRDPAGTGTARIGGDSTNPNVLEVLAV